MLPGKIYQVRGIDVANLTFVRSKTGWIAIDVTTNIEAAAYGLRITEEVLGENIHDNIKAVIISHSHADHFGGIKGIVSPQQVGKAPGQVRIYVPAGFDEETIKENVYAGTAMFHRSKYQFGGDLLAGPKGRVSTGLGLGTSSGTLSYITPTDFIAEDTTLTIDGLEVEFQLTPGTEAPAEMNNYFPEYRAFWQRRTAPERSIISIPFEAHSCGMRRIGGGSRRLHWNATENRQTWYSSLTTGRTGTPRRHRTA